jgi:hypothetical protein
MGKLELGINPLLRGQINVNYFKFVPNRVYQAHLHLVYSDFRTGLANGMVRTAFLSLFISKTKN